jgi:hypothetical protein
MKSLKDKLNSTALFGKQTNLEWITLWEKGYMRLKYSRAIGQMIYDRGRSLTITKKTSETG